MAFRCPSCGAAIPLQDVDADRLTATCRACRKTFDAAGNAEALPPSAPDPPRPEVRAPSDLVVHAGERAVPPGYRVAVARAGEPLRITFPGNRAARDGCSMVVFFAVALGIFVAIGMGAIGGTSAWVLSLTASALAAALILGAVSRNVVVADEVEVAVFVRPVGLRRVRIPSADIDQLFVTQEVVPYGRGSRTIWQLWVQLRGGSQRCLLWSDRSADVLFVEQQIEKRLGIADRRMPGEVRHDVVA